MVANGSGRAIGRGVGLPATLLGVLVVAATAGAQAPGGGQGPPPRPRPAAPAQEKGKAGAQDIAEQFQVDDQGLIRLHANELDIRQALELLSRQGMLNILVSPGVSGTVTINLERATLGQALDAIVKLGGLAVERDGPLIFIRTPQEQTEVRNRTRRMVTKVYRLNYIRSIDFLQMIEPFLTPQARQQGRVKAVATPPSQVGINAGNTVTGAGTAPGTGGAVASLGSGAGGGAAGGAGVASGGITGGNSLSGGDVVVIQDYETVLKTVDEIYKRLDIQPIQVLIEAVILSVELDRTKALGVNFAFVDNMGKTVGEIGNSSEIANTIGFTPLKLLAAPGIIGGPFAGPPAMFNGVAGTGTSGLIAPTNGVKFGFVDKNVSGFIRALETIAETNVLASPRILVLNKQRAEIQLGQRLGYATLSQNFTSTIQQVQFLNTGTLLRLRPFVSSDGMVRMEVHPERSSGAIVGNPGLPQSSTSEVTTNVMLPSGATLVIGGLIENEDDFQWQGPLGASRIPVLSIFGARQRSRIKRELIVLLTPHIWDPNSVSCPPPEFVAASPAAPSGPAPAASATATATAPGRAARGPASRRRWPLGRQARAAGPPTTAPAPTPMTPTPGPMADRRRPAGAKVDDRVARAGLEVDRGPATEEAVYIVRPGETLRTIARDRLGDARRAGEILELNRDSLGESARLTPGQAIFLPAGDRPAR